MLQEHIDRAVKESCPFCKKTCALAELSICPVVESWALSHKAIPKINSGYSLPYSKKNGGSELMPIEDEMK